MNKKIHPKDFSDIQDLHNSPGYKLATSPDINPKLREALEKDQRLDHALKTCPEQDKD